MQCYFNAQFQFANFNNAPLFMALFLSSSFTLAKQKEKKWQKAKAKE